MNGETYLAGKFNYTLRNKLFQEHFGFSESEILDPIDENLWDKINKRAYVNIITFI